MFSCEYCKNFENTYFKNYLQTAASVSKVCKLNKTASNYSE